LTPWTQRKLRSPKTAGRSATKSLPQVSRAFPRRRAQRVSPEGARFQKRPRSFTTGIGA